MLDNRLNNDFISYFLSLLHEEGNKYLQILNKTSHSTPTKQPQHPITNITNITPTNSKQRHEQFENKMQTLNTSLITPKSNSKQRKITPQKLTNTPNSNNVNLSFHNDQNSNGNYYRNRRNNSSFTSPNTYSDNIIMNYPSSPINNFNNSPKPIISFKSASRQTLLSDFISTPIKSPKQANSNILEPLRSLPETSILPSIEKIGLKLSLKNNPNVSPQGKTITVENKEILKAKNQAELGQAVKNALNEIEMKKMDNIAKVYSELILSNFNLYLIFNRSLNFVFFLDNLVFSLNTELFFLFQLLTLNSLDENSKNGNFY
jgi:hypothetical protein